MIKLQKEFPYLKEFRNKFPITPHTVFVFDGDIYSDYKLPPDILVHENKHLNQQEKVGAVKWITQYLEDDKFRLEQEIEAYKIQLESIKDRNERSECRRECASHLASKLYGKITSFREALDVLS